MTKTLSIVMTNTQLQGVDEFLEFVDEDYLSGNGSCQKSCEGEYEELEEALDEYDNLTTEEEYLMTFGYVAGGDSVELGEEMVSEEGLNLSKIGDLEGYTTDELDYLTSDEYLNDDNDHLRGPHLDAIPETLVDAGENLSNGRAEVNTLTDFFEELEFYHENGARDDPHYDKETSTFNRAMDSLRNRDKEDHKSDGLWQFGRVRTVDFLEAMVKVHGKNGEFDYFAEADALHRHVNDSHPGKAVDTVFPDDASNEEINNGLQYLQDKLEDRGIEKKHSLFELETALCEFDKQN